MTIGEKIRIIRKFRNISLEELGVAIGFEEKSAANRMTQYETNYRVPKKDSLIEIAKVLNVNPLNFFVEITGTAEDIMQTLFWLDESSPGSVNLFRLSRDSGRSAGSEDGEVKYADNGTWPAEPPIGLWFRYGTVDVLLREWAIRKEELNRGEITRDEYFDWKLNWPHTCDDEGRHEPRIKWRAEK